MRQKRCITWLNGFGMWRPSKMCNWIFMNMMCAVVLKISSFERAKYNLNINVDLETDIKHTLSSQSGFSVQTNKQTQSENNKFGHIPIATITALTTTEREKKQQTNFESSFFIITVDLFSLLGSIFSLVYSRSWVRVCVCAFVPSVRSVESPTQKLGQQYNAPAWFTCVSPFIKYKHTECVDYYWAAV